MAKFTFGINRDNSVVVWVEAHGQDRHPVWLDASHWLIAAASSVIDVYVRCVLICNG